MGDTHCETRSPVPRKAQTWLKGDRGCAVRWDKPMQRRQRIEKFWGPEASAPGHLLADVFSRRAVSSLISALMGKQRTSANAGRFSAFLARAGVLRSF